MDQDAVAYVKGITAREPDMPGIHGYVGIGDVQGFVGGAVGGAGDADEGTAVVSRGPEDGAIRTHAATAKNDTGVMDQEASVDLVDAFFKQNDAMEALGICGQPGDIVQGSLYPKRSVTAPERNGDACLNVG